MKVAFLLGLLLSNFANKAQSLVADFSIPASACSDQNIYLKNLSTSGATYQWDFCDGDLKQTPSVTLLMNGYGGFGTRTEIEEDNGEYFGFFLSGGSQNLYRLNFGNSLENSPTLTNLGNLGLNSNQLRAITVVKDGGMYVGFIIDSQKNTLYRLDFGSSLQNTPQSPLAIFQATPLNSPFQLTTVLEGSLRYIFVTNNGDGNLIRIKFTSSYLSGISEVFSIAASPQWINSISFIKEGGIWHAACVSFLLGQILKIDFINGISDNAPLITFINSIQPISAELVNENGLYYILAQSRNPQLSLLRLSFGSTLSNTPVATEMPNLGFGSSEIWNFSVFKSKSSWIGFAVEQVGQNMHKVQFPNNCFSGTQYSEEMEPLVLTSTSGVFSTALRVVDSNGNVAYAVKNINIRSQVSPDIDITIQNKCVNNSVLFTSINSSNDITTYAWNFGNTSTSAQPNPSNIYTTAGSYPVTLQVTASNGCINTTKSDVAIYNQPIADFVLPSASPFCTNQNYVFTNQSTFDAASNPTWEWRLNGALVAGTQNLNQAFTSTTTQEIRLKAKIPGCENEVIKNVSTVLAGPLINFTFANGCQASPVSFTNTTSGSVTSYLWTFGDGNSSPFTNASNTYSNIGPFNVTLQANNAAGCQNSLTKTITIYSKPQPDFSIGLPPFSCSGTPSQFTDLTPSPTDSNIASRLWSFGDSFSGTSNFPNPAYTYPTANNYNVSLSVTTNFGCTNTVQKPVTISASPVASFTNLPACVNQVTQFTDASTGGIQSRQWQIQSNTFSAPNPQFTFSSAGSFPVLLTVKGSNGCVSQVSKSIVVPVIPTLDFSIQSPCANNPTVFTEITNNVDPSVSQVWAFGSLANGTNSPTQFSFPSPANYSVRLTSTRQSGCLYSISKNISIVNSPIADFFPSSDAGAAPLPVSFINNSTFANSYQWKFGDKNNSTSLETNPSFVFSDLGNFNVELTASNTVGCTNKSIKIISVVIPRLDMTMKDFFLTKDVTNVLQPVVTVINKSNISITDPVILVDIAGGYSIKKKIIGILKPNQELTQMLDFQIVLGSIKYICAEVEVIGDIDLFQNRKCLSLQGDEIVFAPFPNPAQAELNLDWIEMDGGTVNFQIFNSKGSVCLEQSFTNLAAGINRLTVNTSSLAAGVYVIRFSDSKTTQSYRFAISGY